MNEGVGLMKANLTVIGLSIGLILAGQTNAKNQEVYDSDSLDSSKAFENKCSGLDCFLRMGTFSSEKYANRYKEHLASKTKRPIKIERDQDDKNIFYVIVGPFNDFATMIKSSMELAGSPVSTNTHSRQQHAPQKSVVTRQHPIDKSKNTTSKPARKSIPTFLSTPSKPKKKNNKRTVAYSSLRNTNARMYQTKHQQILASQADYPIKQPPKTDAKGNVIPLFEAGPYLGLTSGVIINTGKTPASVSYQGFNGIVSAGAGHMFTHRFYMAGEFYYGSTVKAANYPAGVNGFSVNNGWFYGGSFIPGYMINDTVLAFLRVGGMRNQFKSVPSTASSLYPPNSRFARRMTSVKNGFQIGGGAQTNLYKQIDVRAEYDFSYYSGIYNQRTKGTVNQINLGLVYKFPDALRRS